MTDTQNTPQNTGEPAASADDAAPKKSYEPPRVVSHDPLEVIAALCTPSPPGKGDGTCGVGMS